MLNKAETTYLTIENIVGDTQGNCRQKAPYSQQFHTFISFSTVRNWGIMGNEKNDFHCCFGKIE
jgi:hypothetical protein